MDDAERRRLERLAYGRTASPAERLGARASLAAEEQRLSALADLTPVAPAPEPAPARRWPVHAVAAGLVSIAAVVITSIVLRPTEPEYSAVPATSERDIVVPASAEPLEPSGPLGEHVDTDEIFLDDDVQQLVELGEISSDGSIGQEWSADGTLYWIGP